MNDANAPESWPAQAGVGTGSNVLLTADVTRMAWKLRHLGTHKVPPILLDAFLKAVGPTGTVAVPTFNYDLRSGEVYDPLRTPTISGVLGQAALQHPAFRRTKHPLHSFAVAGAMQEQFMASDDASSFGEGSPFALFRSAGFNLVGIDLHLNYAMSYFHHVEELEAVRYRKWRTLRIEQRSEGQASTVRTIRSYAKRFGFANELSRLEPDLKAAGVLERGEFAGMPYIRIDLPGSHEVIRSDIRTNKARKIVQFSMRNWLRDVFHALIPPRRTSVSAQLLTEQDAGPL